MNTGKNRLQLYSAISLCVFFAVTITLVLVFMDRNRDRVVEQNQQYLEDTAFQTLKNINDVFDNASNSVALVSRLYELQLDTPEFDFRLLSEISEPLPFDYIRFVNTDGLSYSSDGAYIDCGDREYYTEGIQGRSGVCYIEVSRFTQKSVFVFYTPLYYDGELIGIIAGVMNGEHLAEQMESSYFGESARAYLLLRDGTVAAAYGTGALSGNIIDGMRDASMVTEDVLSQFSDALLSGSTYSYLYSESGDTGNAYLAALTDNQFMLLQTFPPSASRAIIDNANSDALSLEITLIVIFFLYITMVIVYYVHSSRRLVREKEDLSQIVDSVKRLYLRFVVLDIDANTYEYLEEGNITDLGLPAQGTYSDWLETFRLRHEEAPEYWDAIEHLEADNIRSALTINNWYNHYEYKVPGGRWERLTLIKLNMQQESTSRVLGAVEDITDTKKRDAESRQALEAAFRAAEAANRAKSDFLSRMSHDIRTPMNAIIGLTAIMGAHLDDRDRIVDCLAKITSSSRHLLGLINEVLDMSKIESGKIVLAEEDFSLSSLVDDMLTIVQPMVNAKHQDLTVHIQNLTHENVIGDSLRLQQVCINILSNAVKYTGEGGHITMTISELASAQPLLGEYKFIISDDGIGMSPDFLDRIYEPFERANDGQVDKIQGTGLGMSIAQSIAHLMGGSITAASELGKGSQFTLNVSLKLQEENIEIMERLIGLPVLVADDDEIACETTCMLLTELGMNGEWVLTGREAVERVKSHHDEKEDFFAVILDWKMPDMDGLETARVIRQEVGSYVPIIILSAYDWSDIEADARSVGVDAFLSKPLFKSRLQNVFASLQEDETSDAAETISNAAERDYSDKRVLLAEDNELNQEIAKEILEMSGLTVEVAGNGKEALDMFRSSAIRYYDLVFMDIQMPIMDGYEATRAIRGLPREDAATTPIVAMTANTFVEDVQASQRAGMNQHIGKPLDVDQLMAVLDKWLGNGTDGD